MPITTTDLLSPEGPIEPEFFSKETVPSESDPSKSKLVVRLEKYIEKAYVKASGDGFPEIDLDEAAKNWSLYLTFYAAFLIKSNDPASKNQQELGLGSKTFLKSQIDAFKDEYLKYLGKYSDMVIGIPVGSDVPITESNFLGRSTPINYTY